MKCYGCGETVRWWDKVTMEIELDSGNSDVQLHQRCFRAFIHGIEFSVANKAKAIQVRVED